MSQDMKVEIQSDNMGSNSGGGGRGTKSPLTPTSGPGTPSLSRQPSATKTTCLCSPTSHAGSFRCRLHRTPSLQRSKSIDSASTRDSTTKSNAIADDNANTAN